MNKQRRHDIDRLISKLQELAGQFDELSNELETIKNEEEEYRDNIPENLQQSEKYQTTDDACSALDNAYNSLTDVSFDDIISELEAAKGE